MRCPAMMPTITLTWQPRSPGNPARSSPANTKDFPPRPLAKRSVRVTDPSRPNWPVGQPVRSGPLPDAREAVPDRENRLLSGPSASALGGNRTPNLLIRSEPPTDLDRRALPAQRPSTRGFGGWAVRPAPPYTSPSCCVSADPLEDPLEAWTRPTTWMRFERERGIRIRSHPTDHCGPSADVLG